MPEHMQQERLKILLIVLLATFGPDEIALEPCITALPDQFLHFEELDQLQNALLAADHQLRDVIDYDRALVGRRRI